MTANEDRSYFLRRAEDARRLATAAVDNGIRSIHEDMVARYVRAAQRAAAPAR